MTYTQLYSVCFTPTADIDPRLLHVGFGSHKRTSAAYSISRPSYRMVTLAGLEPATSPAPGENKDALSPLSYSAVIILMSVCGGARADKSLQHPLAREF